MSAASSAHVVQGYFDVSEGNVHVLAHLGGLYNTICFMGVHVLLLTSSYAQQMRYSYHLSWVQNGPGHLHSPT